MSWRVSVSFSNREKHLKDNYDTKGKSDYIKMCMNFYEQFKDRLFIIPDNISRPTANTSGKKEIKKLIR